MIMEITKEYKKLTSLSVNIKSKILTTNLKIESYNEENDMLLTTNISKEGIAWIIIQNNIKINKYKSILVDLNIKNHYILERLCEVTPLICTECNGDGFFKEWSEYNDCNKCDGTGLKHLQKVGN